MPASVPLIEITYHADTFCKWRPYAKGHAFYTLYFCRMCAKIFVDFIIHACIEFFQLLYWKHIVKLIRVIICDSTAVFKFCDYMIQSFICPRYKQCKKILIHFFHWEKLFFFVKSDRYRCGIQYKYLYQCFFTLSLAWSQSTSWTVNICILQPFNICPVH